MKLRKFLLLFLLVTLVLSFASCKVISGIGKKHTIKFDSNGGTAIADQVVKSGKSAFEPTAPTKDGYIFAGWYNGDEKWDFSAAVTSDMTLVAKWDVDTTNCSHIDENGDDTCDLCNSPTKFKIVYKDGKKNMSIKSAYTSYSIFSTDFELPVGVKKHYEFLGWFADEALTQPVTSIDVSVGGDIVLYAKFTPTVYTIEYHLNGGENPENNPTSYNVANLTITLHEPTRDGFTFLGWYTDNAFTEQITEINSDNIGNFVVYARWGKQPFTVTYLDHNGNELLVDTVYESESDQPLRSYTDFPTLDVEGYTFLNWVNPENEAESYVYIPAGHNTDLVVKASLRNEAIHHLLYYVNGEYFATGSFRELDGLNDLYIPTKGGYDFDGWYSDRACTVKVSGIAPNTAEDVKLYGKFIPNEYSVSFTVDGVSFDGGFTKYLVSEEGTLLPAIPAKEGHIVLGWYTEDGQLMEENKIAAGMFGDLVLHAEYAKVSYKITYHLGGGTNDDRNVTSYLHDEAPTLYDAGYKTGYNFAGWYTDASYSGTPISDLSAFVNQDISLFALWIPDINEDHSTETPAVPL